VEYRNPLNKAHDRYASRYDSNLFTLPSTWPKASQRLTSGRGLKGSSKNWRWDLLDVSHFNRILDTLNRSRGVFEAVNIAEHRVAAWKMILLAETTTEKEKERKCVEKEMRVHTPARP